MRFLKEATQTTLQIISIRVQGGFSVPDAWAWHLTLCASCTGHRRIWGCCMGSQTLVSSHPCPGLHRAGNHQGCCCFLGQKHSWDHVNNLMSLHVLDTTQNTTAILCSSPDVTAVMGCPCFCLQMCNCPWVPQRSCGHQVLETSCHRLL